MYWVTGILGLILAASPFIFGYTSNITALWVSLIIGGIVVVLSAIEWTRQDKEMWEYTWVVILGIAAIVSPFLFGFTAHTIATWTSVIAGALIALVAGARLYARR